MRKLGGQQVKLKGQSFSITQEALIQSLGGYYEKFGAVPENVGGGLRMKNAEHYTLEYIRVMAAQPNASRQQISEQALLRIPFGRERAALGYTDFFTPRSKSRSIVDAAGVEHHGIPDLEGLEFEVLRGDSTDSIVLPLLVGRGFLPPR